MTGRKPLLSARAVDVLLAVGVTVVIASVVSAGQASDQAGPVDPVAYLWAVGLGLLMLIRRAFPRLVLVLTVLGFFSYYAAGFPAIGVAVPIAAALYSAAELGHLRAAILTGLGVLVGATGFRLLDGQSAAYVVGFELAGHVTLVAAVIALGFSVRAHRALVAKTEQVARLSAYQAMLQAETRAHDERVRLGRELHDSIGHFLSVASLHNNVAREATDPASRDRALEQVRSTLSEAMGQLRATVSLLRSSETEPPPAPALSEIGRLLETPAAAGYEVDLDIADVEVSPEVGATVFRVVQEAITNTLRHSDASRIAVSIRPEGSDLVEVSVSDDGTRTRPPRFAPGRGLAGMRERAEAVGGRLEVRSAGDGWHVDLSLPRRRA